MAVTTLYSPAVRLTWTTGSAPAAFGIRINGVLKRTLDPNDVRVSGNTYRYTWWRAVPQAINTYEVESIDAVGPGRRSSKVNLTATIKTVVGGKWLVDESPTNPAWIFIADQDEVTFDIGDNATVYNPVGSRAPVRISDGLRGYEGTITGRLLTSAQRDTFLEMIGRRRHLRFVNSTLNFPVELGQCSVSPAPIGDLWPMSAEIFQVGEFFTARGQS